MVLPPWEKQNVETNWWDVEGCQVFYSCYNVAPPVSNLNSYRSTWKAPVQVVFSQEDSITARKKGGSYSQLVNSAELTDNVASSLKLTASYLFRRNLHYWKENWHLKRVYLYASVNSEAKKGFKVKAR